MILNLYLSKLSLSEFLQEGVISCKEISAAGKFRWIFVVLELCPDWRCFSPFDLWVGGLFWLCISVYCEKRYISFTDSASGSSLSEKTAITGSFPTATTPSGIILTTAVPGSTGKIMFASIHFN